MLVPDRGRFGEAVVSDGLVVELDGAVATIEEECVVKAAAAVAEEFVEAAALAGGFIFVNLRPAGKLG